MEYFVNLPTDQFLRPGEWAKEMETVGWHGVCASEPKYFYVNDRSGKFGNGCIHKNR